MLDLFSKYAHLILAGGSLALAIITGVHTGYANRNWFYTHDAKIGANNDHGILFRRLDAITVWVIIESILAAYHVLSWKVIRDSTPAWLKRIGDFAAAALMPLVISLAAMYGGLSHITTFMVLLLVSLYLSVEFMNKGSGDEVATDYNAAKTFADSVGTSFAIVLLVYAFIHYGRETSCVRDNHILIMLVFATVYMGLHAFATLPGRMNLYSLPAFEDYMGSYNLARTVIVTAFIWTMGILAIYIHRDVDINNCAFTLSD